MKKNNLPLNLLERSNSRISFLVSVIVMTVLVLIFHQMDETMIQKPAREAAQLAQKEKEEAEQKAAQPEVYTASILAVGDDLYQNIPLLAGESDSGTWNYDFVYTNVKNKIQNADLAIVPQETVLTSRHELVSTDDSAFATPTEVGDALINAGFDVIAGASNHVDDFGSDYINQTLNYWSAHPEVNLIGLHEAGNPTDVRILEINGISIGLVNYTYGTNQYGSDSTSDSMIDMFDQAKVTDAVSKARSASDVVILVAHWGDNDRTEPSDFEKQWATYLMKQGVDVIIGSHPHVLQPYGTLSDEQGNQLLVFYSLGNFVTGQTMLDNVLGGMAEFTIRKTVFDGETTVEVVDPQVEATVMHEGYSDGSGAVYMLDDYTDTLASAHMITAIGDEEFTVDILKNRFREIMEKNVTPDGKTDKMTYSSSSYDEYDDDYDDYDDYDYDDYDYEEDY